MRSRYIVRGLVNGQGREVVGGACCTKQAASHGVAEGIGIGTGADEYGHGARFVLFDERGHPLADFPGCDGAVYEVLLAIAIHCKTDVQPVGQPLLELNAGRALERIWSLLKWEAPCRTRTGQS